MGGQKPHLLVTTKNNLGADTEIQYAPSTKFYLQDKAAGTPWATKLPFPVHVVERVTVRDKWRGTSFSSTYSYHHGYFDGAEREFRGFGRVEQVDAEDYGTFADANITSPYITQDRRLYQPPVKTVTWYHTGALLDGERILHQFQREYFPGWFEDLQPGQQVLGTFYERALPEPDLDAQSLTADERREALRACKGMPLRQEVYELDAGALVKGQRDAGQALLGDLACLPHPAGAAAGRQPPRGLPRHRERGDQLPLRARPARRDAHARPAHHPHAEPERRRVRQHPAGCHGRLPAVAGGAAERPTPARTGPRR